LLRSPTWNAQSWVQTGYIAALACVALISIAAYTNLQRLTLSSVWVSHTDQVISQLEQLRAGTISAESAARGYVITDDRRYLAPFERAKASVAERAQLVRALTADNVLQQQHIGELQTLVNVRLTALDDLIASRDAQGFEAAKKLVADEQARAMRESIRSLIGEMTDVERGLLHERQQRLQRRSTITQITLIAGGLLAFVFVSLSLVAMRRDFAGRRRAEAALREANAQLEQRVQLRTTELRVANESLEASERRFRAFVRATSDGIFRMSADWTELQHLQGEKFVAGTPDAGVNWLEKNIPTDYQDQMSREVAEAIQERRTFALEHPVRHQDGTLGWTYSRAVPLTGEDGSIVEWFGAATDITARKRAEERLYTQLSRLKLLGEITRAIGERQDSNSIFQVVLRTLEEQLPIDFGCIASYDALKDEIEVTRVGAKSRELALGMALTEQARFAVDQNGLSRCCRRDELVYEPDILGASFPFASRLAAGGLRSLVIAPLSAGGKVFGLMAVARHAADSFQSADCEFLRQLSEHLALAAHQSQLHGSLQQAYEDLRDTQQVVMEQERLRVLGQMASGIAHDINNALSPAALYLQSLLESDPSLSDEARAYLKIAEQSIQDVAGTIARLREFYRPREYEMTMTHLDLNAVVGRVMDLTRVRWRDMPQEHGFVIEPRVELEPALSPILGAEHEVRDALTNLVLNAIDAMPAGGALTVRTLQHVAAADDDDSVVVEVSDTGVGMTAEVRQRCLEPFFTTKGERGTGLGLAMVYGMAQRHGAGLDVESVPGKGTVMRLKFPVARTAAADMVLAPEPVAQAMRVLVVDDDPLLLRSLRDILERDGHDVCAADGGQAGIDEFYAACARDQPFAAVITDLGMPNIDGRAVSSVVKARAPQTAVILLTGWGHRLQGDQKPEYVDFVLNKPPRLNELRAALAQTRTAVAAATTRLD
jgi:signal transduction histidine kinase/CHASE3 domain sensor protein/ActR/RegA family two-component response regulator